ncbi:MAG: hypothetical protein J5641_06360 [Bacteroidales bacterium]|nr:hypothetical protein [Bacteroidales bacterium]
MNTDNSIKETLASQMSGDDVRRLARELPARQLYDNIFGTDNRVARNAAWALTHKPASELIPLPQDRLVDFALSTPDTSLRRLTLALIERQGIKEEDMRTDLLDFCLRHMVLLDEPSGIQALCLKLAYQMCGYYPELMREFEETLNLMQPESYKAGMRHLIMKTKKQIQK